MATLILPVRCRATAILPTKAMTSNDSLVSAHESPVTSAY